MKLKDILKDPIKIMVRTNSPPRFIDEDMLFGYCEWDGNKLISLDGDSYSLDMEIYNYEFESDGSLIVWFKSEWI